MLHLHCTVKYRLVWSVVVIDKVIFQVLFVAWLCLCVKKGKERVASDGDGDTTTAISGALSPLKLGGREFSFSSSSYRL